LGSGGNLATARQALGGAGTQTAALGFGGYSYPPLQRRNSTEEYDGSAWAAGGNLTTARQSLGGAGTQTAAVGFGGYIGPYSAATEEYDGSTWSPGGNLSTARYEMAGAGTQTAALAAGGYTSSPVGLTNATEEYDGSTWTGGGNLYCSKIYFSRSRHSNSRISFWWSYTNHYMLQKNMMVLLGQQVEI
jgi:hypothetical protein